MQIIISTEIAFRIKIIQFFGHFIREVEDEKMVNVFCSDDFGGFLCSERLCTRSEI